MQSIAPDHRLSEFIKKFAMSLRQYVVNDTANLYAQTHRVPLNKYSEIYDDTAAVFKALPAQSLAVLLDTLGINTNADRSEIVWDNATVKNDKLRIDDQANIKHDLATIRQRIAEALDEPGLFLNLTITDGWLTIRKALTLAHDLAKALRSEYPEFCVVVRPSDHWPDVWSSIRILGKKPNVSFADVWQAIVDGRYEDGIDDPTTKELCEKLLKEMPTAREQFLALFHRIYDLDGNLVAVNPVDNNHSLVTSVDCSEIYVYLNSTEEDVTGLDALVAELNAELAVEYARVYEMNPHKPFYLVVVDVDHSVAGFSAIKLRKLAEMLELKPVRCEVDGYVTGAELTAVCSPLVTTG